jgi:hypothetical protein
VDVGEQLVATLLEKPELLDEVPGLEPSDFVSYKLQVVFAAIRNLQARGEEVSMHSVDSYFVALDEVRGTVCRLHAGRSYLLALARVNPVPGVARDADHVRAWAGLLRRERWDREMAARSIEEGTRP